MKCKHKNSGSYIRDHVFTIIDKTNTVSQSPYCIFHSYFVFTLFGPQARHKFVFRALQQLAAVGSGANASAAATGAFSVSSSSSSTLGAPSSAASFADVLLRLDFNHHYRDEYARQREPMRMPPK